MRNVDRIHIVGIAIVLLFILSCVFFYEYHYQVTDKESVNSSKKYTRIETKTDYGIRVDFFDSEGHIYVPCGNYSTIEKTFDLEGRVIVERFYYDGKPVASTWGQYGVQCDYDENGHLSEIIYLDIDDQPMNCSLGYSTIRKTYYDDGNIKDELYFDTEGKPVKLSSGQYGVRYKNGKTYYLDANGKVKFDLNLFIKQDACIVVVIGMMLCFIFILTKNKITLAITIAYLFFILGQTLLGRTEGFGAANLELFWSYKQFLSNYNYRIQILNNIWLFIPFGAGLYSLIHKPYCLILPFVLSMSIETAQYFFCLGLCEFDDIFSNTLGGIIGFIMAYEIEAILSWNRRKRKKCFGMERIKSLCHKNQKKRC